MTEQPSSSSGKSPGAASERLPDRIGHFRPLRKLGEGGAATVLLAEDLEIPGRRVALKILKPGGLHRNLEALRREASVLAALQNDGIVTVHEVGSSQEGTYLVMEYLPGGSLQDRFDRGDAYPLTDGLSDAIRIAEALHVAHLRQIVHCDIKPGNILFTDAGSPRIGDFGLALHANANPQLEGDSGEVTAPLIPPRESGVAGTPGYMAPELLQGSPPTPSTDQYAFGVTLHQILTGRHPYHGVPWTEAMYGEGAVIDPSLPADLQSIIRRCLSPDPTDRHPSMADVLSALRKAVAKRSPSRRRIITLTRFGIAILMIVTLSWLGWNYSKRRRALTLNEAAVGAFVRNDHEAAFRDFSRAHLLDPNLEAACTNLGMLSISEGNLNRAVTILEDCAERFSQSSAVLAGLGRALWDRGDLVEAERCLREALKSDANSRSSMLMVNDLALILIEKVEGEKALALFDDLTLPDASTLEGAVLRKTFGLALLASGRNEEALPALETALKGPLPPSPLGAALLGLGRGREAVGDLAGARKAYSRAILEAAETPQAVQARQALERLARGDP